CNHLISLNDPPNLGLHPSACAHHAVSARNQPTLMCSSLQVIDLRALAASLRSLPVPNPVCSLAWLGSRLVIATRPTCTSLQENKQEKYFFSDKFGQSIEFS
ncbi:uncharacterized protein PgNI_02527, partial [Pyricularia grisea]|uniref:Uncharacterized protein n=1 Tax=Pyricularia grisea TaxID=148305 RepID=A0A6P8BJ31_PYRGI